MGALTQVLSAQDVSKNVMRPNHKFTNLPESLVKEAGMVETRDFNAVEHIKYEAPSKIFTTHELGLGEIGISNTAVSEPFSLFSEDAIKQMRREVFNPEVLDRFHCQTGPSSGQVRGHCPEYAPFIYNAWNSPELLKIVSDIAGVDLVPAMPYDMGHTNISINSTGGEEKDSIAPGEQTATNSSGYCESAFGWHTDSYPFVVVTMLSDCEGMVGGETAIRTGNGTPMKARGPRLGTAVVMQGQYVQHAATPAVSGRERISMVTSFRPKSATIKDGTILRGVRNISNLETLYRQFSEYRLENLEDRVRDELRLLHKNHTAKRKFDTAQLREWLFEQREYIDHMLREVRAD
ncbi:hypothetical protein MBLNU230_g1549t1 [Neophaeotheca triangularis]